jgi:hypothetical protein
MLQAREAQLMIFQQIKFAIIPTLIVILTWTCSQPALAQLEFEQEPILYQTHPPNDPVARLTRKLNTGETALAFDERFGYLPALLKELNVPQSSQMLVFSKTSFQLRRISRQRPRALYFNDEISIGFVQDGDVLEISSVDPQQGAMFYTLSQEPSEQPVILRDKGQCLICHASSRTQNVPGHLVRSVFADLGGQPQYGSGTFSTDHKSPFSERWGGWFVTGTHGDMRHMGNVASTSKLNPEELDREAGANVTDLSEFVKTAPYLQPTSDLVALMVLEHQTQVHNLITRANYEARHSAYYDGIMNAAFKDRPADYVSETTQRRIASAGDKLLDYLLFRDEFQLTAPVKGVSQFADEFAGLGMRDKQGRSLRDFDLKRRLFKYPCSYLIYSPAFDQLPNPVKAYVSGRLLEVFTRKDIQDDYSHLSLEDRANILQILKDTKPDLFSVEQ